MLNLFFEKEVELLRVTVPLVFPLFSVSTGQISERGTAIDMKHLRGQGETVQVVDDDALQRDIAAKMLTLPEYTPRVVASGEEAVSFLEHGAVDLILLDMLMEPGEWLSDLGGNNREASRPEGDYCQWFFRE